MDKEKLDICGNCKPLKNSSSADSDDRSLEEAKYEEILCCFCTGHDQPSLAVLLVKGQPCCIQCKAKLSTTVSPMKPSKYKIKTPIHKVSLSELINDEEYESESKVAKYNRSSTSFTPSIMKRSKLILISNPFRFYSDILYTSKSRIKY